MNNTKDNDELENQLFVYCYDDELKYLFNLLEKYGYKNVHNLNPSTLKSDTNVFCIDKKENSLSL